MSATTLQLGLWICAVSAGIAGGATFAFSNFIMRGFDRLAPVEAARAMQAVNVTAINPLFMLVLIGTGVAAAGLSVAQRVTTGELNPWLAAGAIIYALGVVLVTMAGNVPLNETLAGVAPESLSASSWTTYARPWTLWNHLRTAAAAVAALAFMVAART
jgi:uncharacterized membrane protein